MKTLTYDEPFIEFANTFSWQGEKFELRKDQTNHISFRNRRAIFTMDHLLPENHSPDDHLPIREDETELAAFVMAERISVLNEYLTGTARKPFLFARRLYILTVFKSDERDFKKLAEEVLEKLWKDYGIANAILMTPCKGSQDVSLKLPSDTFINDMCIIVINIAIFSSSEHISPTKYELSTIKPHGANFYGCK